MSHAPARPFRPISQAKEVTRMFDNDLTEAEIELLKNSSVPDEVKQYLSRSHDKIGLRAAAYAKVAAAARAERQAILEVRALAIVKGEGVALDEARRTIERLRRQAGALESHAVAQQRVITNLSGATAMAVHSEP